MLQGLQDAIKTWFRLAQGCPVAPWGWAAC